MRQRRVPGYVERHSAPAARTAAAFRVCLGPPVFDHALPCQHSYETKQLLRCLHGGDRELHRRARTIERFLDTLNRENRVIFMRRYWYSDSYAAIAALTGLTEKNVSVRLARVRKQLRDYLMKQGVLT